MFYINSSENSNESSVHSSDTDQKQQPNSPSPKNWVNKLIIGIAIMIGISMFFNLLRSFDDKKTELFVSDEGRFKVAFSDKPIFDRKIMNSRIGELPLSIYSVNEGEYFFAVSYFDIPEIPEGLDIKDMLDAARDGAIANTHGKLLYEEIIDIYGYSGREIKVIGKDNKTIVISRIVLVGNRLYQYLVSTKDANAFSDRIKSFLDSFELLN